MAVRIRPLVPFLEEIQADKLNVGFFIPDKNADVVELVDTLASGASGLTAVGVQVSPSAPIFLREVWNTV